MILDPYGVPMVEYMDRLVLALSSLGALPVFTTGMMWQEWAAAVVLIPGIAKFNPPNPNTFDEWLPWVIEFNKTVLVNVQ